MYNFEKDTIIIWDSEFTTWEWAMFRWWSGQNEYRELVEIWAIKIDTKTFEIIDEFHFYVKPKINPELSEYFTGLTWITQDKVDKYWINFWEVMVNFEKWAFWMDLYSYWNDKNILVENCWLNGVIFPSKSFVCKDVRKVFDSFWIEASKFSSWTIHKSVWLNTKNIEHTAIWDSINILNTLEYIYNNKI